MCVFHAKRAVVPREFERSNDARVSVGFAAGRSAFILSLAWTIVVCNCFSILVPVYYDAAVQITMTPTTKPSTALTTFLISSSVVY
jgi:hypothetical protein